MAEKMREGKVRCSFCQKTEDQVRKLIAGPDGKVFICDECIGICSEIMEEELNPYDDEVLNSDINLLKPMQIKELLDGIDVTEIDVLNVRSKKIRDMIFGTPLPNDLREEILEAYRILSAEYTMEEADVLYGVTMQEEGVSKLLELRVSEIEQKLGMKQEN